MYLPFKIIREFGLDDYLAIVIKHSTSNKAPYHNFYHVMCKIKNTYKIAKSLNYEPEQIRTLILADLFHDFNHSMGKHDDVWNVETAKREFMRYSKETLEVNMQVLVCIDATQYPYVIEDKDLTLDQKIMRDSDLLQQYEDNFFQQVYFGLSEELNYTVEQLLIGYPQFIDSMKLYTDYAKMLADDLKPARTEDINYLTNLLNKNQ